MSSETPMRTTGSGAGSLDAHRLLDLVSRLKEVRRRFVFSAGDGERFDITEERLDAVIANLDGWLKPGGRPVALGDLDLRLAVVEEMMTTVGFPAYAHIIGSVRASLAALAEDAARDDEPPPPRRFEPKPPTENRRAGADADASGVPGRWDDGRFRAVRPWLLWALAMVCVAAALVLWPRPPARTDLDAAPTSLESIPETSAAVRPVPKRAPGTSGDAPPITDGFDASVRDWHRLQTEIEHVEAALRDDDLDRALRHFAAAAAVDRHHQRVQATAKTLIAALLTASDAAFDDSRWELADRRVADARHLARGLYLDTAAIDQMARKHAAMTRFNDVAPTDTEGIRLAVGHAVRLRLVSRDVLFGRLEAFDGGDLTLAVHSGVEGGGMKFETTVGLARVDELRVYESEHPSETVLGE